VRTQTEPYSPGRTITRCGYRGPHLSWAQAVRVVADDDRGLLLWLPAGADFAFRVGPDGRGLRTASIEGFGAARLELGSWRQTSVLILHPPAVAHSAWWFFRGGEFSHWYFNLESPFTRAAESIASVDHHLDLVVHPDRSWEWKDEDEFAESIGMAGYWDAAQAAQIRSEGERAVAAVESGAFPFDGTWCDFAPEPSWPVPKFPQAILAGIRSSEQATRASNQHDDVPQ
jgi:Protein of unknown function (DUF402)